MKKTDGRSKAARAAKEKAKQKAAEAAYQAAADAIKNAGANVWVNDHQKEPHEEVKVGGVSVLGREYVPLNFDNPVGALNTQIGGEHYRTMRIQPMEYSMKNKLDPCQHTIIKYVSRFRTKGGIEDLEKAKHVIDMLIEFERGA